ncbi:MAG TPA: dihydrolipoyl dehydrogenase [Nitrososphaera sp.]|nr:dihydrolipoyl dehydrogenase [Nitrososphaera sp.]
MQEFDLIVIGSGSGLDVANVVAQEGKRVAIIEKGRMGGTCLNRGCIPSKLLIHSADVMETIKTAGQFGVNVTGFSVDFEKIVNRTNGIVDSDSDGIRQAFSQIENPKLFPDECRFVGEKTISVGGQTIKADKILIASGTRPAIPKIEGLEGSGFITSDEALRLKKQPRVLTIIGGGYVAAELAHFFGSLGTKINIIQRRDILLPDEDEEVARKFTDMFSKKYSIHLGYHTQSVSKSGGTFTVVAKNSPSRKIEVESDQLLIATGRTPNSDTLDLGKTGVKTDSAGFIAVDNHLETNVKGIFALGDAVGRYLFKHAANHEAQYAYYNLTHDKKIPVDYTAMPHAVFSWPQVAGAGYTEQELKQNNIQYSKAIYLYIRTAMGEAIEDRDGFVKLLASKEGKILGCHIIGSQASILIHEVLVAMKLGAGVNSIVRTVHIHPALSEVVSRAASSFG